SHARNTCGFSLHRGRRGCRYGRFHRLCRPRRPARGPAHGRRYPPLYVAGRRAIRRCTAGTRRYCLPHAIGTARNSHRHPHLLGRRTIFAGLDTKDERTIMITVDNLSFRTILHNISLQIPDHGITGLVGPNGSGKTTLLRCMYGAHKPTSGQVLVGATPLPAYAFSLSVTISPCRSPTTVLPVWSVPLAPARPRCCAACTAPISRRPGRCLSMTLRCQNSPPAT